MSRRERQRLEDILAAMAAIRDHRSRGPVQDQLIFDAIRVRLIEIGEAVKELPSEVLAREPDVSWTDIARMRDHLTHRYFDASHAIVEATVDRDLPTLEAAVDRLLQSLD